MLYGALLLNIAILDIYSISNIFLVAIYSYKILFTCKFKQYTYKCVNFYAVKNIRDHFT